MPSMRLILSCITLSLLPTLTQGHGFLSTPRSRNLVAYEDRIYYQETENDPFPEDCPSCINRGGSMARCGILNPGAGEAARNYDFPKNALGNAMPANPQEIYEDGGLIDVEVVLSAHHKGHFVFKACPIAFTTISPTQECFDEHPLLFVEDKLYGGPVDENHPERVYVAPEHHPRKVLSDKDGFELSMVFQFRMRLPEGVTGDLVLIQWYYVASNSGCVHDGYAEYPWPEDWIKSLDNDEELSHWEQKLSVGMGLSSCEEDGALPPDGNGVPEQFWNCAEVSIMPSGTLPEAEEEPQNTQLQSDKTIIGYFASWQWYDRDKFAEPWLFDYRKYTRVNFAFFQINEQGDMWGTDAWADPNLIFGPYNWNGIEGEDPVYCHWDTPTSKVCKHHHYEKGLLHLAREAGAEVWPSIGGWSLSDPFPAMAANPTARARFAQKCVELIEEYGFDGIDIDWEYPGYEAHSGTPQDTESYNLLLRDVREKLEELGEKNGKFYGLTAALPCGTGHINNIDIPTAARYLTELNLMTYDFFGAWSPTTGVNAPLHDQDWGGEDVARYSIDGCVKNWMEGGGTPSQINIGLPFYGRGFMGAKHLNETHDGKPDKVSWWQDEGSPQYFNIVNKLSELTSFRHELTSTQYAYNDVGMVSYDDEEAICDKTEYCLEHDLNGFIIWEMSGDLMDDGTTPLIDVVHAKLKDPTLDCKELAYDPNTFSGYATPKGNEIIASFPRPAIAVADISSEAVMSCPTPTFWGIVPWDECKSYYKCVNGKPDMTTLSFCHEGELYNEASGACAEASLVTCATMQGEAAEQAQLEPAGFQYEPECPPSFSNFKSGPGCTSYYRCNNGDLISPVTACKPGTLFDETLLICNFEALVHCTETYAPTSLTTPTPTEYPVTNTPTRHPVTNNPTRHPVTPNPTRHPVSSSPTRHPVTNDPTRHPATPNPTRHPVTSYPTRHPVTNDPTRYPVQSALEFQNEPVQMVIESPTSTYEIIQAESNTIIFEVPIQVQKPSKRPTRKPKTQRPTRRMPTSGGNSFVNEPTPSYMNLSQSGPYIVEYKPTKGEENLGDKIKNQIQQKMAKKEKKRGNGRGKKGKKKKKGTTKKNKKRQKKGKKRQKNKRNPEIESTG